MTTPTPVRSIALDYEKLKISHADYSSLSHSQARQRIKLILDLANFAIATEEISGRAAKSLLEDGATPGKASSRAVIDGITWVMANHDGTADTGPIKYGQSVAFDTTTGKTVTGVNSVWDTSEYKIVGIALDEMLESGQRLIPIKLQAAEPLKYYGEILAAIDHNGAEFLEGASQIPEGSDGSSPHSIVTRSIGNETELPSIDATLYGVAVENGKAYYRHLADKVKIYNPTPWRYYHANAPYGQIYDNDLVVVERHNGIYIVRQAKTWSPHACYSLSAWSAGATSEKFAQFNVYASGDTTTATIGTNKTSGDFTKTIDGDGTGYGYYGINQLVQITARTPAKWYEISYSIRFSVTYGIGNTAASASAKVTYGQSGITATVLADTILTDSLGLGFDGIDPPGHPVTKIQSRVFSFSDTIKVKLAYNSTFGLLINLSSTAGVLTIGNPNGLLSIKPLF